VRVVVLCKHIKVSRVTRRLAYRDSAEERLTRAVVDISLKLALLFVIFVYIDSLVTAGWRGNWALKLRLPTF